MKKMYSKKLLAMLSALSMTVGMFTAVPASAETQSILNENFDGATKAPQRVFASYDDTGNAAYGTAAHFQTVGEVDKVGTSLLQLGYDFGSVQSGGTVIYSFDINAEAFNTSVAKFNYIDFRIFNTRPDNTWGNTATCVLRVGSRDQDGKLYAVPSDANYSFIEKIGDENVKKTLEKNQWYRIDMILDLDEGRITYYLNGASWASQDLKDGDGNAITSLGGFITSRNNLYNNTSVFIDNINIRKVDSAMGDMKIESSSFNNDQNYVDVKLSETIRDSAADLEQKIQVNNAKNNSSVEIDSVTKLTADTIRVAFAEGALSAASEYKVTLSGINNPFGGDPVSGTVTFNTPSSKDNSVIEDFNLFDVNTKTVKFGSIWNAADATTTYTLVAGKSGEESDKAVQIQKAAGNNGYPAFRMNIAATNGFGFNTQRRLGAVSYEFDFKIPATTAGTLQDMTLSLENPNTGIVLNLAGKSKGILNPENKTVANYTADEWHNVRVQLDYINNKINYYLDGAKVGEYGKDLSSFSTVSYNGFLACGSVNDGNKQWGDYLDYTIDNFKISYEETATQGVGEDNTIGIKGFAVTESENGYTVSGTGVNTYAEEKRITVIVCGYDSNGVLTYVNCDPEVALGALRTTSISKEYETDKGSIATVKAFAWENTTGMTPCVMPAQYPNS